MKVTVTMILVLVVLRHGQEESHGAFLLSHPGCSLFIYKKKKKLPKTEQVGSFLGIQLRHAQTKPLTDPVTSKAFPIMSSTGLGREWKKKYPMVLGNQMNCNCLRSPYVKNLDKSRKVTDFH